MTPIVKLKKKDFESDQDVRWCPGCGDYAVLATVQRTLASLGVEKHNQVFISGIGCSSRFPYYMQTYGFHSIHGRAPSIATGLKVTRPELDVWVITGDGDSLSIGGNHLLHVLRRNVDVNILLFNNRIYGLTKGQYSPTSTPGTVAPSTPFGSVDSPVNPIAFAIGANASFIARAPDTDAQLLGTVLERAHAHRGTSFVEILQNCPVFNDGVWDDVAAKSNRADNLIYLEDGKPLTYGKDQDKVLVQNGFDVGVQQLAEGQDVPANAIVHSETGSSTYAHLLSQLQHPETAVPVGVLRAIERPTYDGAVAQQNAEQIKTKGKGDLTTLLESGMTWRVS